MNEKVTVSVSCTPKGGPEVAGRIAQRVLNKNYTIKIEEIKKKLKEKRKKDRVIWQNR